MSSSTRSSNWYYAQDGNAVGPISLNELQALLKKNTLSYDLLVIEEGKTEWVPINTVIDVTAFIPSPPQLNVTASEAAKKIKRHIHPVRKGLFGCLGILLLLLMLLAIGDGISSKISSLKSSGDAAVTDASDYSNVTWNEIHQLYGIKSNHSDLQKDEEWKRFKGKRILWNGEVVEVSKSIFGALLLNVRMEHDTFTSDLIITLNDSSKEKALKLNKGDYVQFSGKLDRWGTLIPISITEGMIE